MNILMMSNTYKPFVGGVERSIDSFSGEFRRRGHRVLIVAPKFNHMEEEEGVVRVGAIQNFNGTDFSVPLPISGGLAEVLRKFKPDIVHSQHPFFMGDTALRVAARYSVPIVFTFHTFFERYTHYVPGDSPLLKRFVSALATGYANMCNTVIAPSESVSQELKKRGVIAAIDVVPTGIDVDLFGRGDRQGFRTRAGIPRCAFVAGFVSRLAPEKNIYFLVAAVARFLAKNPYAHFLVTGSGPSLPIVQNLLKNKNLSERVHLTGILQGRELADAYHAMDVFVFASKTETQGLVLAEAMAAGVPVIAVDAMAVRDIIVDGKNGRLLMREDAGAFSALLEQQSGLPDPEKRKMSRNARKTAEQFSIERSAGRLLCIYSALLDAKVTVGDRRKRSWEEAKRLIMAQWGIVSDVATATEAAFAENFQQGPA